MAFYHHGTIRKYTGAILNLFNELEIQHKNKAGQVITKQIPLVYSAREKSRIFDKISTEQLLAGNYSVLPRASLSLGDIRKSEQRMTNKNLKINHLKTENNISYSFNSVPYEFTFDIVVQCRGMNELSQIIEQIAPKFNPTVNIDIWDADNLSEPTRVPVTLLDIAFETEDYSELSSNIFTATFTLSMMGNLHQPINTHDRIKEFQISVNQINGDYFKDKTLLGWDIDENGSAINPAVISEP